MLKRLNIKILNGKIFGIEDYIRSLPWSDACSITIANGACNVELAIDESEIDEFLRALGDFVGEACELVPCLLEGDVDRPLKSPIVIDELLTIAPYGGKNACNRGLNQEIPFVLTIRCDSAFGFGTHPSTIGALKALASLYRKNVIGGKKVLDIGTGSGILALTAWRFGAHFVKGIDIDQRAIIEAKRNRALNGCPDEQVIFKCISCMEITLNDFDIILANLVPSVRDKFLKAKRRFSIIKDNTMLIVSGGKAIDRKYVSFLETALGFQLIEEWTIDGWLTTLFERR